MQIPAAYASTIEAQAAASGLNAAAGGNGAALLAGVLDVESGFNPTAVHNDSNGTQDDGIAQLNLSAQGVTSAQADNPTFAITRAAQLLSAHIQTCGSVAAGVEAYNVGHCTSPGAYSAAVLAAAQKYGYSGSASSSPTATPGFLASLSGPSTSITAQLGAKGPAVLGAVRIGIIGMAVVVGIVAVIALV